MESEEKGPVSRAQRIRGHLTFMLSFPGWQTIREVYERSARLLEALAHGPEPVDHEEQQYDLGQEDHDLEGLDQQLHVPIVHRGLRSVLGATAEAARGAYAERRPDRQALGVRPDQPRKARVKALASE